jgi:O-antigen/teichoic acid export membrane protein
MTSEAVNAVASVDATRTRRLAAHLRAPLHRNAYALVASTLLTAVLGFLYWLIAARRYSAEDVGVNAVLINTMMFLTNFASLNFTDVLNRFVPVSGRRTNRLVWGSYAIAVGLGAAIATVFVAGLALNLWGKSFTGVVHGPALALFFVVSTMLWVVFVLEDAVLIGLRHASYVLTENSLYGIAKIVLLVALATTAPRSGIFLSWTAPLLVMVVAVNLVVFARLMPAHKKDPVETESIDRGELTRFVAADYVASIVWTATIWLLPVLVLATEGKAASAYATISWTICYTLYLVSRQMGMSLTTEGARDPHRLAEHTRATLISAGRLVIPGALLLFAFAPWVLRIFGEEYAANATGLMRFLALSTIPALVNFTFVSVARVERRLAAMVVVSVATTLPVLALTPILLHTLGLAGAGLAWLIVQSAVAVVLLLGELRPHVTGNRVPRLEIATMEPAVAALASLGTVGTVGTVGAVTAEDAVPHEVVPQAPPEPKARPAMPVLVRAEPEPQPAEVQRRRRLRFDTVWPVVTLGTALGLWIASLAAIKTSAIGEYGLLSAMPVTYFAAIAVVILGVVLALQRGARLWILVAHAALFILIVHATPAIVYDTLRYAWAYRHVGIVELLQRTHRLSPSTPVLPIYQSWPGFFAAATALTESAGLKSALSFASWGPAFFELLNLGALVFVFSALTDDRRRIGLAVWLFLIANWVSQDYFAPQALGFFLYLVVIGIVLRYYRRPEEQRPWRRARSSVPDLVPVDHASVVRGPERRAAALLLLVLFAAITSSHPLTPIVTCTALLGLLFLRVLTVRWPALVMLAMTAVWMATGARQYVVNQGSTITGQVGKLGSNVDSNLSDVGKLSHAQQLVATMGRGVVVALAVLAIIGFLRRVAAGHWDLESTWLCAAPAAIFVGGSYGGEAVFRVYLFALPFAAFLAAGAFYGNRAARARFGKGVLVLLLSCLLVAGFGFAYFGKEQWFYTSPSEFKAAQIVFQNAPPNSLLVSGTQNFPTAFDHQENFIYVSIADEPPVSRNSVIKDPVGVLYTWMADPVHAQAYLIFTRSQFLESDETGLMRRGELQRIEQKLLASDRFDVLYHDKDAVVLTVPRTATPEGGPTG